MHYTHSRLTSNTLRSVLTYTLRRPRETPNTAGARKKTNSRVSHRVTEMLRHLQSGLAAENMNQVMLQKKNNGEKETVHDAEKVQHFLGSYNLSCRTESYTLPVFSKITQNIRIHLKFYISMCWCLCVGHSLVLPPSGRNEELHQHSVFIIRLILHYLFLTWVSLKQGLWFNLNV